MLHNYIGGIGRGCHGGHSEGELWEAALVALVPTVPFSTRTSPVPGRAWSLSIFKVNIRSCAPGFHWRHTVESET